MLEELKKMKEELQELKNSHLEKSKEIFGNITKRLFEEHKKLKSFSWVQYTPYFNDGDTCEFGVHKDTDYGLLINESEDNSNDGNEFLDETITEYGEYDSVKRLYPDKKEIPNPKYDKELAYACNDVSAFMEEMADEVLKQMFGDHVKVIVTSEGVETEGYSHD